MNETTVIIVLFIFTGCVFTSDICTAVLPLVPSITIARAEEMLKGEKKIFPVLWSSLRFLNKARVKVVLALDRGLFPVILSENRTKGLDLLHNEL